MKASRSSKPALTDSVRFTLTAAVLKALRINQDYPFAIVRLANGNLGSYGDIDPGVKVGGKISGNQVLLVVHAMDINSILHPILSADAALVFLAEAKKEWSLSPDGRLTREGRLMIVSIGLGEDVTEAHATILVSQLALETADAEINQLINCCRASSAVNQLLQN